MQRIRIDYPFGEATQPTAVQPTAEEVKKEKVKKAAGKVLDTSANVLSDPGGSQEKGQSSLLSTLSKKTGLDLTKLPKLRVSTTPGKWAKAATWKTKTLRQIAAAAKKAVPAVVLEPSKHASVVEAGIDALASAKNDLDAAKGLVGGNVEAGKLYNRLAVRWFETASGFLYGAIYVASGKPVDTLGIALAVYVLTVKGIKFPAPAVSFASHGGTEYARALARDAAKLKSALATGTALPGVPKDERSGGGGGLLVLGLLGLAVGGVVLLKKRRTVRA